MSPCRPGGSWGGSPLGIPRPATQSPTDSSWRSWISEWICYECCSCRNKTPLTPSSVSIARIAPVIVLSELSVTWPTLLLLSSLLSSHWLINASLQFETVEKKERGKRAIRNKLTSKRQSETRLSMAAMVAISETRHVCYELAKNIWADKISKWRVIGLHSGWIRREIEKGRRRIKRGGGGLLRFE